jgi:general secretion pathway protein J
MIEAAESDKGDEAGFTVVEVLVALALFTLLSTVVFETVRFGLTSWTIGSSSAQHIDQVITSQGVIRRLLADAYPSTFGRYSGNRYVEFSGTRNSVTFLASAPDVIGGGGRFRYTIAIASREETADLVVNAEPELTIEGDHRLKTRAVLLPDVRRVEFSYFDADRSYQGDRWRAEWNNRDELPKLIRVSATFADGDRRYWPDLVVSPRISVDAHCTYDPLTVRCKGR